MKIKEPAVMGEIRAVRDLMAEAVERKGIFAFYASLKGRAAKLMERYRSPNPILRPRSATQRKLRRRALARSLPESAAVREVHRIRMEADGKSRGAAHGRAHRYGESPSSPYVLHDKPRKK